jgi:hypothetical protein
MYPLGDDDRRKGSNCPILMISSEHWNLTKHQAPFRKDLKQNTIQKRTQELEGSHHTHHLDSFHHPFVVTILGSDHLNYCDMVYLTSPLLMTRANYLGKTNPYHFSVAKDHLVLRFFIASTGHDLPLQHETTVDHDSKDLQETSPLHNEHEGTSTRLSSSPHSVTITGPVTSHKDVDRLFHYCQIPMNDDKTLSPAVDLSQWSTIEPIPKSIVSYLERNLVDESSLPHCYDDEFFNQINQQLV